MAIEFDITRKDIQSGIRKNYYYCPVNIAAERHFNTKCATTGGFITVTEKNDNVKYFLINEEHTEMIENYDKGQKMVPFRIKLEEYFA